MNEFKEASVKNEATPQIIPTQESDDIPQLTSLSPPLDKDENNSNISDVAKAQIDDDVELEDKEQQRHQNQHQVSSTPPPSRTQESLQSPLTPTPTFQLFKEDGVEVVESEISTVGKKDTLALDDEVEAVVEMTGTTVVESAKETSITLFSSIKEIEQAEELKSKRDQDQDQGKGEKEDEEEEEGSKVMEEVVVTEEESLVVEGKSLEIEETSLEVEKKQVVEDEEGDEDLAIAEKELVLVFEDKENEQEQEDVEVTVQNDDFAIMEELLSANFDAAVLDDSKAIETVVEPLPANIQTEDQQLQAEEVNLTEMFEEELVELEAPEELEPEDAEVPVEQEQILTQKEAVETVGLEAPFGSVAGETVDCVVPILDEEIENDCHPEDVAIPEVLEIVAVEQVESTETPLVNASAPLTVEAVTVEVQAINVEEIAIVDEDIQDVKTVAQEEATSLESESDLALAVVKIMEVVETAPVDENEVVESDITPVEEEVAIKSIDEDIEDTEMDQPDIESEELSSEEDSYEIVDEQIEIHESSKYVSNGIEEAPVGTSEPQSSKKVEIDEFVIGLMETVESLEVLVVESSFKEVEAEKVVEMDEVPSGSTLLESEASLEVSKTDISSAEEISLSIDQIDPTCVSHKFVWNHGGRSVKVTGSFDNWKESVELKKNNDAFEAIIGLDRTKVIHFKFVVDGQWLCASDLATEFDHGGNQNHILHALV
ncbi:hypothetical protein BGZ93_010673 [Podila epicladia]|nr:hypothetical protein BGZ93_010673 [Podila epicladia]